MLFTLVWIQAVVQVTVLAEEILAPPQNIHVDKWLLSWTAASEDRDVTYTVQYRSFDTSAWKDVPVCVQIPFNSCNVNFSKAESEHGCVMLRVQAERHRLTSTPVEACSRHGDSCTPAVSLTVRPGSMTVYLSRNNSMALEHGSHVKHRVYYGKEGQRLEQKYKDAASSVSIHELEEGQRYCTKVQYIYFNMLSGPESCIQCKVIPAKHEPKQIDVIVAVVGVIIVMAILILAYLLILRRGRLKQCLQPPCEIPDHFFLEPFPEHHISRSTSNPSEEHWSIISSIE